MSTGYVKKLANKHHTSVGKSESVWEDAKKQATKAGKSENFAYITSIYKKMMGEDAKDLSLKGFLAITEMDDVQDMGYSRNKKYEDNFDDEDEFSDDEFGDESEDEFSDDEFGDESEDEFGEDDLEGHEGHELQGIVGDDELNDEECDPETEECDMDDEFGDESEGDDFDEDEFPEEDFPGGDEEPDENGEFPPEDEIPPSNHKRFREGYETKGSLLQQLMIITEKAKKKPLKKAAKAVYHRDYKKTKNKPYRKYDPSQREHEKLTEGPLDYLKGMGQHLGGKFVDKMAEKGRQIAQPFVQAHQAGQQASRQGDLRAQQAKKAKLAQQEQVNTANRMKKAQAALQTTLQDLGPLMLNIYNLEKQQTSTNEGLFDYLRGAGKAVGGAARSAGQAIGNAGRAVGGAVTQVHQQGQQASQQANLTNMKNQQQQLIQRLCKIADVIGPDMVVNAMKKMYAQRQINLYNKMKKQFLAACQSTR